MDEKMEVEQTEVGESTLPDSTAAPPAPATAAENNEMLLKMLDMGYSKEQAERALKETNSIETALEWLVSHGDDTESGATRTAKSYKCVETGKLFRSMTDAMIYAEKTGRSNFEETDVEIPPLTPEERAERLKKVKDLIKVKLAQREENEKKEQLEREKARRAGGREMAKIREEQAAMQRQRDAELREKEKQRFEAEAKRLREQVARDRAERAYEKAKRLGQGDPKEAYDKAYAAAMGAGSTAEKKPEDRAEAALTVIEAFRLGGKGLECVKTVKKLLQNAAANPGEPKYRKINLGNETIKAKIVSVQGGVALLKAAGFDASPEDANYLVLPEGFDVKRVEVVLEKVTQRESRFI